MPTTFLELTNGLLRRLNEVEIASADFPNTRGIQSLAKDAVKSSISKINQMEFEWPFNASEHTEVVVPGTSEYAWPSGFKVADWDSFHIVAHSEIGAGTQRLRYINRDEWYRNYREADLTAATEGLSTPSMVFPSHGTGYGITPSPDKAYTIRFRYFLNYTVLDAATDESRVPSAFDTTIIDGALYYMYMFKDNAESAARTLQVFTEGVKDLQSLYINHYDSVTDRRVNFGGYTGRTMSGRFG